MTLVLPALIAREMRAAARQPPCYYLRSLSAAALVTVFGMMVVEGGDKLARGEQLFARLHAMLLGAIWVLVPLFTADCISRERREQTLPILFLTRLKPRHVVLAKGMAHGLRAFTLWLAVLPVLAIPFILGGVSWIEAALSVLLTFSSICLAIAAGLVASAWSRASARAIILAASLGAIFFLGLVTELGLLATGTGVRLPFKWIPNQSDHWAVFTFGMDLATDAGACWQNFIGATLPFWLRMGGYVRPVAPFGTNLPLLMNAGLLTLTSVLAFFLWIELAAWNLNRIWQELPPSEKVVRLQKKFCGQLYFNRLFQRWRGWQLNRNPIGWLERRTWSARLVSLGWFAALSCIYSCLLANFWIYEGGFHNVQRFLAWLLLASIALSSARSFHRERQTGLLELLLVCPLRETQIIGARIRGLWGQFLPTVILFLGFWIFLASLLARESDEITSALFCGAGFLAVPVIGLYQSLKRRNFISAFLCTLLLALVLPLIAFKAVDFLQPGAKALGEPTGLLHGAGRGLILAVSIQAGFAAVCAWRLHRDLKRRHFAFVQTE